MKCRDAGHEFRLGASQDAECLMRACVRRDWKLQAWARCAFIRHPADWHRRRTPKYLPTARSSSADLIIAKLKCGYELYARGCASQLREAYQLVHDHNRMCKLWSVSRESQLWTECQLTLCKVPIHEGRSECSESLLRTKET